MDEQKTMITIEPLKFKKVNNIYIISDRASIHKKFMIDDNTEEEFENVLLKKEHYIQTCGWNFLFIQNTLL